MGARYLILSKISIAPSATDCQPRATPIQRRTRGGTSCPAEEGYRDNLDMAGRTSSAQAARRHRARLETTHPHDRANQTMERKRPLPEAPTALWSRCRTTHCRSCR
eukprot:7650166-Pyramimonas_sp.AAC.1